MYSYLTHLECTNCGETYPTDQLITTCPACGKVLYARYDLAAAARQMTKEALLTRPVEPVALPRDHAGAGSGACAHPG